MQLIDTGAAVARQTRRLLNKAQTLRAEPADRDPAALAGAQQIQLMTTGQLSALQAAAARWLDVPASRCVQVQIDSKPIAASA